MCDTRRAVCRLIHPQCNPAIFTVAVLCVVLRERVRIGKDLDPFFKSDVVLSSVALSLARVPLRLILDCSFTSALSHEALGPARAFHVVVSAPRIAQLLENCATLCAVEVIGNVATHGRNCSALEYRYVQAPRADHSAQRLCRHKRAARMSLTNQQRVTCADRRV
jgi:hypothetical protein